MAIEVYWGSGSPYAWRVLLALEIKRIPYESRRLSFSDTDLKSDAFLAINPRGQVPAIRDGDYSLHESLAILSYLEDKQPEPGLFGGGPAERGRIWCSIMECVYFLEPHMTHFAGTIFSGELPEKRSEAIQSRQTVEQEFARLNQTLAQAKFLAGNSLSAADVAYYPVIQLLVRAAERENSEAVSGKLLNIEDHYPALQSWFERIEAIPGYELTYPPHWK